MSHDDLRYEPPAQGLAWLVPMTPESCLVIGDVADESRDQVAAVASQVRTASGSPFTQILHRGTYAYLDGESWHVLISTQGKEPRGSDSGRLRFTEDGHLTIARMLHQQLWAAAQPFAGSSRFHPGDMVRPAGSDVVGRVTEVVRTAGGYQYKVDVRGQTMRYLEEALRLEAGDPSDPEFWLSQVPAGADGLALTLTWTKLRHPLTDTLYSFAASKTLFRAYQFRPVLKVLTGSSGRLLIADEVGLGKTIEAGLIWSELEQRNRLDRVLVVAPAALTLKWKAEMERRFDRRLAVLRPADLAILAEDVAAGKEPILHGVVSLEALRSADGVLERLTELHPRIDLVIVDEAHYLRNRESKSHAMGRLLADWSDYLIFLSATPLNLGNDDLFNLVNLLDEASFADQAVFEQQLEPNEVLNDVARSLLDVGRHEPRKLVARLGDLDSLRFGSSVTERPDFAILRGILDVDRPLNHDEVARTRRLLADLNILGGVLTRTRKADTPDRRAVRQPVNIDVAWTEAERDYYDAVYDWYMRRARSMGTPPGFAMQMPLRQAASCIPASQELIRQRGNVFTEFDDFDEETEADLSGLNVSMLTVPLSVDTKYDRLLEELLRVRAAGLRQIMIFSFFRRTLGYLARRLREHMPVEVMHGGVPMPERERIMRDFRTGRFDVLLVSEVGSEGLDFEFCNVLVNYDLPWNPMRVEQRIGRLDRFGQQHEKIFIYNMRVPGTIETDIFQRLYDRIGVFQNSIGELEPILRDQLADITRRLLDPLLDATGRQREVDRISVALQQRGHQLDELRAAQTQLAGLDGLLVEGLTDSGPSRGRFIGRAEIGRLLNELFLRFGGSCDQPDDNGIVRLVGSDRLAARLRASMVRDGGSRHSRSKLAALLQSGTPVLSTFDPESASRHDAELLSARHPLVKLAMEVLADESLDLPRFGSVSVPGLPAGRRYLVTFDLAHTTGLRELLELWATAIDLDTRDLAPDVGEAVLTALAEGTLGDGLPERPAALKAALHLAHGHVADRQAQAERIRGQENAALVDGRIRARESSLDLQIQKTEEIIGRLRSEGRAASIIRLQVGRLRNLRARRAEIADELSTRRPLSVSLAAIAVVLAERTPAGPSPSPGTRRSAGRVRSG